MDTARDVLAHAQAHAADLIVMAPHHRTMMAGAFFGTLAQSLDHGINVSLLFVH
jgi:nucleotide-binding universal stress UspA family protein